MARTKLIAAYARLDTPDLAERIAQRVNDFISDADLDCLPEMQLIGRHTGTLRIANGGFMGDYDFVVPFLRLCRLDCHGILSANMRKIELYVNEWRESLYTPDESDIDLGYDDEHFDSSELTDDDVNEMESAALEAEIFSGMHSENLNIDRESRESCLKFVEQPPFSEFVAQMRNGEFGPLPDDYDALASPGEPGYYD